MNESDREADMVMPLVSVIIPSYNHDRYVRQAIESVIAQDYPRMELVVIDDGSQDDSQNVIAALSQRCLKRFERFEFRHRANIGLSATLNEGLGWCRGEYVSVLASDDIMMPGKTALQVRFLSSHPDYAGVFGGVKVIGAKGETVRENAGAEKDFFFDEIFLHGFSLPAATQMVRADALRDVGGYEPSYAIEDWYMWLALTRSGAPLKLMPDVLAAYRRHEGNTSAQLEHMKNERLKIVSLYSDHRLFSPALEACYYVSCRQMLQQGERQLFWDAFKELMARRPIAILNPKLLRLLFRVYFPKEGGQ